MKLEARAGAVAYRAIKAVVGQSPVIIRQQQEPTALYLLVMGGNLPGALAGEAVGCTKQNVSQVLRKVEDRRDDPTFDAELERLSQLLFGEL